MIGFAPVSHADFVAAWGDSVELSQVESGEYRLDLDANGLCAWEMSAVMAAAVLEVLACQGYHSPLVRLNGRAGLVLIGLADVPPPEGQEGVLARVGARCHRQGMLELPCPDSDDWYTRPHLDAAFGPVDVVVDAIARATPIGTRHRDHER